MAVTVSNVLGTDYNSANVSSTADAQVTKPTAVVDGVLEYIIAAIRDLTAGTFSVTNLTGESIVSAATSAPTQHQAGTMRRAGLTADAATVDVNNSNGANAQKTGTVVVVTGHNVASPIRESGTPATGTSSAPQSPTTAGTAVSGDGIMRAIAWFDDGDDLVCTVPAGHVGFSFKPAAAGGIGIGFAFIASTGGAAGTATWALTGTARPWVAFTDVIAQGAAAGNLAWITA